MNAAATPLAPQAAIESGGRRWSRDELLEEAARLGSVLRAQGITVLASLMDNGAAWVIADLAAAQAGIVHVPLPPFFSEQQLRHALSAAGVNGLLTLPALAARWVPGEVAPVQIAGSSWTCVPLRTAPAAIPPGTSKITFTSGTTGTPKGVCLNGRAMHAVAGGLVEALAPLGIQRHLCALPLTVLLENIAGLMAPLRQGATCIVAPLNELGLQGSSKFDAGKFDRAVREHRADSVILLPQMLRAWTGLLTHTGQRAPESLKFVAVGGAAVGRPLIEAARAVGIPAYEGYGLSEGASVQTLNLPGADLPGSAGKPLPHAQLRVSPEGEIEVRGSLFNGYVGEPVEIPDWWPSGDLGEIDPQGFVHIRGRKKNLLITSFGRNVSPEWIETALTSQPAIGQAVLFGEGMSSLCAVIWPLAASIGDDAVQSAVDTVNAGLPDYARVGAWTRAGAPFDADSGFATTNGRPRRDAIWQAHKQSLPQAPGGDTTRCSSMEFHSQLVAQTTEARNGLLGVPIVQGCLRGEVSLPSYLAFLESAYHHVKHTVPLLAACKAALPARLEWLQGALLEYIEEERGHEEWILDDIKACGGDAEAVRQGRPNHAVEVMVAYAYDTIARRNPLGFFGMVYVLEGTSVALALAAADQIQQGLGLPASAFSYLRSHGILDREHTAHFANLMDMIDDPDDQADIVHAARAFYRLYGDVFRSLPLPSPKASGEVA